MEKEELISHIKKIAAGLTMHGLWGDMAQSKDLIENYAGKNNSFLKSLIQIDSEYSANSTKITALRSVLLGFSDYVEKGLLREISLEREIQIDTVSDYLEQAEVLLNDSKVHPAAPAVIIGASLEEFLRNWLEEIGVDLQNIHMNIDSYCKELRSRDLLTKQDVKDITSWGGIRNDAAHGHWDNVKEKERIKLMLQGVNLFMRKYTK